MKRTIVRSLTLAAAVAVTPAVASAGLVAEWNIDAGPPATTIEESISNTNSDALTTASGVTWGPAGTSPDSQASLTYTGANGDFTLDTNVSGAGLAGTGSKTFVAWVNPTAGDGSILSYSPTNGNGAGEDLRMLINGDGDLRAEVSSGFFIYDGDSLLNDGWKMVAVVFDTDTATSKMYIEGIGLVSPTSNDPNDRAIDTAGSTSTGGVINFTIGGDQAGRGFTGGIDKVQVYDMALTESQLDALLVPEPASLALVGLGSLLVMGGRRRRA